MANIADSRPYMRQEGDLNDAISAGAVYAGTLLGFTTDGKVASATNALPFAGIAADTVADGEKVRYWMEGIVDINCAAAVGIPANLGKLVIVVDNNTIALADGTEGANLIVGKIVAINSTTSVRVKL